MYEIVCSMVAGVVVWLAERARIGEEVEERIRGMGWRAVKDCRAFSAERRLELGLALCGAGGTEEIQNFGENDKKMHPVTNERKWSLKKHHSPLFQLVDFSECLCIPDVFDDVLYALQLKLCVCSKEADGDKLGAGRTGSRFSAFSWDNTGTEKMEVQLQNR
jgi:hypothetical protein